MVSLAVVSSLSSAVPAKTVKTMGTTIKTPRSRISTAKMTGSSSGELLKLSWEDVQVGRLLGSGTFASVYLVESVLSPTRTLPDEGPEEDSKQDQTVATECETWCDSSRSVFSSNNQKHYFALKCFQESSIKDETSRSKASQLAAECLSKEAEILASLPRHPNVIQLMGVSTNLEEDPTNGFLLLRRVSTTLEELLKRWKIRSMSSSFLEDDFGWNPFSIVSKRRMKQERLLEEQQSRINQVAVGLSRAMAFLHSHEILYRDLKPGNVGIDYEGQVRLFDFGFARTLDQRSSDEDRLLTKLIGTPRYMAGEVHDGHYGFPADVYSFAILLWQIVTLKKPFKQFGTVELLQQAVFSNNHRPSVRGVASRDLRTLLKASWHPNPDMRPTFALISRQLVIEGSEKDCCSTA